MDSDFERLLYSHSQNLRQDVSRRFNAEGRGSIVKEFRQADQNGHPARPQPMATPQAYPLGYVEDVDEPRTKPGSVFIRPATIWRSGSPYNYCAFLEEA